MSDAPFQFEFLPAPEGLDSYVNTLFTFSTDLAELNDVLPAYSAQLCVFAQGRSSMIFPDGTTGHTSDSFFITPLQQSAAFAMAGPVRAAGVSLTPQGWAALTALPVDEFGNRAMSTHDVFPPAIAKRLPPSARHSGLARLIRRALPARWRK